MTDTSKMSHFAPDARFVLQSAENETYRLANTIVGTEHMLLALLDVEGSSAESVLTEMAIDISELKKKLEQSARSRKHSASDSIELSENFKKMLEQAVDETRRRYLDQITADLLLLGLLKYKKGTAIKILKEARVNLNIFYRKVAVQAGLSSKNPFTSLVDWLRGWG